MNISENLHFLRKRDKITQEELADKLGVSRQSVSKWETGEAYPETDKLIALCEIFGVSLDELVRGDISEREEDKPDDGGVFIRHMDKFSLWISAGVFFIIFGVAVCLVITGYSFALSNTLPELTSVMGAVAVLVFVGIAVFMFVYSGIEHDRFRKEYTSVSGVYSEEEVKIFTKRYALKMALLISGIIADVVFLIVMNVLLSEGIIHVPLLNEAICYVVSAFMFVLSFLVGGIVYYGIQHTKYIVAEYNRQNKKDLNPTPRSKLKDSICGAIMLSATALFLVLGFVWGWWHPGWVVFPVGGIICGIVGAIMGAKDDH